MDIIICRTNLVYNSPLAPLILEATKELELLYEGNSRTVSYDSKAFYSIDENKQVTGLLCYSVADWIQDSTITLGYVKPECRRQGVYTKLYEAFEKDAISSGIRTISGYTHVKNLDLQAAATKQGRRPRFVEYMKDLPFVHSEVEADKADTSKTDGAQGDTNATN